MRRQRRREDQVHVPGHLLGEVKSPGGRDARRGDDRGMTRRGEEREGGAWRGGGREEEESEPIIAGTRA